jgi:hypothetical protein
MHVDFLKFFEAIDMDLSFLVSIFL